VLTEGLHQRPREGCKGEGFSSGLHPHSAFIFKDSSLLDDKHEAFPKLMLLPSC